MFCFRQCSVQLGISSLALRWTVSTPVEEGPAVSIVNISSSLTKKYLANGTTAHCLYTVCVCVCNVYGLCVSFQGLIFPLMSK